MPLFSARSSRRTLVVLSAATLALAGLMAGATPAIAATGSVSGTVYRDFNSNGVRDTGNPSAGVQTDVGIADVTVTAYDAHGAVVGTDTTDAAGDYSIATATVADGTPLRIEFDSPEGYYPSFLGSDNGSSVQFAAAGSEDVDFLVNNPDDFAQANAPVFTAIQSTGVPSGTSSGAAAIVGLPWGAPNNSPGTFTGRKTVATFGQVGSVWGLSYDSVGNDVYAAATYKRHSGLGALGLGGIYRINNVLAADGTMVNSPALEQWLDVSTLVNVGTAQSNTDRALGTTGSTPGTDVDAFAKAGKIGIGGITVTPDGSTLLFVNLFDRNVYALDLTNGTPTEAVKIDLADDLGANQRPWALQIYRDELYVGYVDAGSTPGQLASAAELSAYVVSAPLDEALAGSPTWTPRLTADLGYRKGMNAENWGGGGTAANWKTTRPQVDHWNTWTDTWTWSGASSSTATTSVGLAATGGSWGNGNVQLYPQAILSTLAFDTEGYLNLGFTDRTGIQGGNRNYPAITGATSPLFETLASGDLLLASPNEDGTYTLENDGIVGDRTTATPESNDEGPDGDTTREFYNDGQNLGNPGNHQDVPLGSVVSYPGVNQVMSTAFDPLGSIRVSGAMWFNPTNGAPVRGYEHTTDPGGSTPSSSFEKGGGLGSVALARVTPPVQIGDRVWFDADKNGRQDADEPAITNAPVSLFRAGEDGKPTGEEIASTTTDSNGNYVFDSSLWTESGFDDPAAELVVVFGKPSASTPVTFAWGGVFANPDFAGLTWGDLGFTTQESSDAENDSNADRTTGEAPVTVGGPGQNDHTIDAGFVASFDLSVTKELAEGSAPAPEGTTFEISVSVVDFRGDPLPDSPYVLELAVGESDTIELPAFASVQSIVETNGDDYDAQVSGTLPALADDDLAFTVENSIPRTYALGDYVWIDADRDGIQDIGELPLKGVTVSLYQDETEIASTTTNDQGRYDFDLLPAGTYEIRFVLTQEQAELYKFTIEGAGGAGNDSNADPSTGFTSEIVLDSTNQNLVPGDEYTHAEILATDGIDPTWDAGVVLIGVPSLEINKSDAVLEGNNWVAVNDADTLADGVVYQPGETRTILVTVTNTGTEPLREVTFTDTTISGASVSGLSWTLPSGSSLTATPGSDGVLTAKWEDTFGEGTALWLPGETVTGLATLTVPLSSDPHVNVADVTATSAWNGIPLEDDNPYNAFTGGIQVIKYDGSKADPAVKDGDAWIIPAKPLADADQDANDSDHAVEYPVDTDRTVRWVVTNTGTTWLTNLSLEDVTDAGPEIGDDWTADLSAFGGPTDYSFVNSGAWQGLLPPGASFFATGTLAIPAEQTHADTVDVIATVVVPAQDPETLEPTGQPELDEEDQPVRATLEDGETPFTVDDDDPFNAWTGVGPFVDIEKGDGEGTAITNDADTMTDAEFYTPGETRTVVFVVQNTGDEDLREVGMSDVTISGATVDSLKWTLPGDITRDATYSDQGWSFEWAETFGDGEAVWEPGQYIYGSATLTVEASAAPHVDRVRVDATGALSGIPVNDVDDYNAATAAIQVIKYDGTKEDPIVRDGDAWVTPTKPLVDADQDANDKAHAVGYEVESKNAVRWVVTNTGTTWLTNLTLDDTTLSGIALGDDWTADLTPFGGPAKYSFVESGPWTGMLPPGASFFAEGTLQLGENQDHADEVVVIANPITPETDENGAPTGEPLVDEGGEPVLITDDEDNPVTVTDDDPFHAYALPLVIAPETPLATVLAMTGSSISLVIGCVALLLVLGGLVVVLARRRNELRNAE